MNSEVFFNDGFSESDEKAEINCQTGRWINLSWIRVLLCAVILMSLVFCRNFYKQYYTKIGEFYSVNFGNDDEKIYEMKNFVLDRINVLRLKAKEKINKL